MNSARRLIESVFSKPSVFKNREALYPEYVPTVLPHREEQIKQLAEIFKSLIISPGSISQRAMLVGGVGTGKTVTARAFGRELRALAKGRGLDLRYIHVNCHRDRTLFEVITEIARQLGAPVPFRGLSAQEIFVALLNYMERENVYALVTLDEFDYLINIAGNDAVYFLVRIYDEYPEMVKRVSYIFIARDLLALRKLDPATESYILKHVVRFNPYTSSELFDILSARRSEAFYEGTVPDEVLRYIAEYEGIDKGGGGNARAALETLLLAGEAADHDGLGRVTVEHVRRALGIVNPDIVVVNDLLVY
ncbi:MAG: cell division control protein Cdc6, partial [Thermoprotei archaeon]